MIEFKSGMLWASEDEAPIIGRIILGYTELEVSFWRILATALQDKAQATRIMFRSKNAENRLLVADAILRKVFSDTPYAAKYANVYGELQACRVTRNALAHAYWEREDGILQYVKLEDAAQSKEGIIDAQREALPSSKLKEKEKIFIRVNRALEELDELLTNHLLTLPLISRTEQTTNN